MRNDEMSLARGVAQGSATHPAMTEMAAKSLLDFLRHQIVDAEWQIARYRASISAYEAAIEAIGSRYIRTQKDAADAR